MAILIVEDEFLVAAEIRYQLERGGFAAVEHAATERAALAAISARPWDAAIVDANLNGRSIDSVAEALRLKGIPFVIVTGYGREGLSAALAGAPVIDKPFQPATLLSTLIRLCSREPG